MDIRCHACNKLFRVADEKIAGKGIRFKCSKCGEVITVTKEDLEREKAGAAVPETPPAPPAREEQPAPPAFAVPPAPPAAQPSFAEPSAAPQPPAPSLDEFQPREYQPPQAQEEGEQPPAAPPAGLEDFDFSEPHAAAQAEPDHEETGEPAFAFGGPSEEPAAEQGAPELSLSEEEAKTAEDEAFAFPTDLISEPKHKPLFGAGEVEEAAAPTAQPAEAVTKPAPAFGGDELAGAASEAASAEIDIGQALAIPKTAEPEASYAAAEKPEKSFSAEPRPRGASRAAAEEIHPLASGNMTGAAAGFGCALPVVALLAFGFGMMVKAIPAFASLPLIYLTFLAGAGIIGMGVMTGIVIALAQAKAGRKLFFLVNILIGTAFGALFGGVMNAVMSLVSGTGLNLFGVIGATVSSGILAFLISIVIVIARRFMVNEREESSDAVFTNLQKAGLGISTLIVLFTVYSQGAMTAKMAQMQPPAVSRPALAEYTPAGLSVENAQGTIDPATGDLIVTGAVRNSLDKPKAGWYLEVNVLDADQKTLATLKMLNGIQLYSPADYALLAKRGTNIDEQQAKLLAAMQSGVVPAKDSVSFSIRMLNPPAAAASFLPALKKMNPQAAISSIVDSGTK